MTLLSLFFVSPSGLLPPPPSQSPSTEYLSCLSLSPISFSISYCSLYFVSLLFLKASSSCRPFFRCASLSYCPLREAHYALFPPSLLALQNTSSSAQNQGRLSRAAARDSPLIRYHDFSSGHLILCGLWEIVFGREPPWSLPAGALLNGTCWMVYNLPGDRTSILVYRPVRRRVFETSVGDLFVGVAVCQGPIRSAC